MFKNVHLRRWASAHRLELAFLAFLLLLMPLRGYWAPDEPDFAQCVKEMRLRGDWLFPWLNGQIYTEKPILFYWLMKGAALGAEALTGGAGFARGIAPWALRLPSILAAAGLIYATRAWARRFLGPTAGNLGALVLATTPLWIWQGQFIQIDMVFAALLAGSWMCWFAGYTLAPRQPEGEARAWYAAAYALLGLALLAKGPLGLVLSAGVVLTFLAWQRDLGALGRMGLLPGSLLTLAIVLPWYLAAGLKGGPQYAYAMVVHQNVERALQAWDHLQPWWRYITYLAGDFFPWSLLLPVAAVALVRQGRRLPAAQRFTLAAWIVPLLLLSLSKSKQGKYLLMAYPFLALTVALGLRHLGGGTLRRLRRGVGLALALPGLALLLAAGLHLGGPRLQAQLHPFLGPALLGGTLLLAGGFWVAWRGRGARRLTLHTALALGLVFVLVLPWTFLRLDPTKDYRGWARQSEPFLAHRRVYYWGDIRSGAMIYSDRLLPVLTRAEDLRILGPEDRLIVAERRWKPGIQGLDPATQARFRTLHRQPQGGDGLQILAPADPGVPPSAP